MPDNEEGRPLSPQCASMWQYVKTLFPQENLRLDDLGSNNCVIDVKHQALDPAKIQSSSSIYIHGNGDLIAETMVPHCPVGKKIEDELPVSVGMELCAPGCEIRRVHIHSGEMPTTHLQIRCKYEELPSKPSKQDCLLKIGELMKRVDTYINETCKRKT